MSSNAARHGRWLFALLAVVSCLAACQVKQEVRILRPLRDPNLPVNPANIPVDSPAHLVCAEARFYLQFDGMAQWRAAREHDPLVEHLWSAIAEIRPRGMWDPATKALGLDEDALTDRYFGQCLAIVGEKPDTSAPYALISRVSPTDLQTLPAAMGLKPIHLPAPAGAVPFAVFTSADGSLLFAIQNEWLIVGPLKYKEHFDATVAFAGSRLTASLGLLHAHTGTPTPQSLVEDDDFQKLVVKLPAQRQLFFYTRDKARKGQHAASVAMEGPQLVAQYAGTIDKMDELYEQFAHGDRIDFGIMPQSTISAASVNLVKKDGKGLAMLNLFLFPRNIREHVLPKLAAPMVVFLGKVAGENIAPNPGVNVPAVGIAIRMNDPGVANDLNRIVGGLHFMANVGQLDLIEGVFGGRQVKSPDGLEYRIADFGDAIVKQIKDPEAARMFKLPDAAGLTHITYGPIGSWFVICSQESLFKECAAAHADASLRFMATDTFATFPLEMREGLLISALTRAPQLAALTQELNRYWEKMEAKSREAAVPGARPELAATTKKKEDEDAPASGARKVRQPMEWVANAIKHRDSFYMQVWRDSDGDLRGMLSTIAPPKASDNSATAVTREPLER